ncbi:hypothetical protein B0H10DRAFT_382610 [Mycena sp. CBHHK59/15]|nr:hypothetical protein B0H10DRAFT_382610 [Mycena sp. CBHHK59/15]
MEARLGQYGLVERVRRFEDGRPCAFVDFMDVAAAAWAESDLRQNNVDVKIGEDRCLAAGNARSVAIRNRSRTISLDGTPPGTSVTDICDQIKGGALENITFLPERGVAFVHFLEHSSALSFHRYALYHGINLQNKRLVPRFKRNSPPLVAQVYHNSRLGCSRALHVGGKVLNKDALWRDCQCYGQVEHVSVSEATQSATVSYTDIRSAILASQVMHSRPGYGRLEIGFAKDRCAEPFEGELKAAKVLQAQLDSLLIPGIG